MILPVSPPLLIPWLTCVNSPGFPVHPGVAVYSSLVTTTDGHVRVPDASPNRGSDRLVSGIDSAGSNRGSSQQLSRLLPTPSEEANYSPFYVESGPGVNSLKKLQVYFTSRTLVLKSSHKFELNIKVFTGSCYKPPTCTHNVFCRNQLLHVRLHMRSLQLHKSALVASSIELTPS